MAILYITSQKPWQKCRGDCVIVPKRFVKKAHSRNKIRRQIKYVIRTKALKAIRDKKLCVIYQDQNQTPSFQELTNAIIAEYNCYISKLKICK